MRIKKGKDLLLAALTLLVCALLYHQTYFISEGLVVGLGAAAFPRGVLIVTMILAGILAAQSLDFGKAKTGEESPERGNRFDVKVFLYRWGLVALLGLYILALPVAGYLPTTIAFMTACMLYLGYRTWRSALIYLCISTAVAYLLQYVFGVMLHLFLP